MDVEEIQKRKYNLECTIFGLLKDFENETKVSVSDVEISTHMILGKCNPSVYEFKTKIEL